MSVVGAAPFATTVGGKRSMRHEHKCDGVLEETVGVFLLRRLKEIGLSHVFGVAGDFNLELLEQLEGDAALQWVGCCNELNAAYAADGYARTHGVGALVTTYGVGELSALCGLAGSYAEHLPVVAITGAPPLSEIERKALLHHTAGDGNYDNMMACGREFSVAQSRITPQNAVSEIDRCLRACMLQKRPVYIQIPSDLAYTRIETPAEPLRIEFRSDASMLREFTDAAIQRIQASTSVAILADADVERFNRATTVMQLADKLGCSIAVMGTAKGVIDETQPSYLGVYSGALSPPDVRETIEGAECLIQLAVRFIDSTTASFSERIAPERSIEINAWRGRVDTDDFQGICMGDILDSLVAAVDQRPSNRPARPERPARPTSPHLSQAWFWPRMTDFLREGDVVIAENGTSLSGVAGMALPAGVQVISQALWGAIGYSLPATFGSLIAAPQRRHILFIGDGSFQLTVQELSSILRHHLKPIIFLINNDGYTIERLILGENSSYNDIQPWRYASICEVFAAGAEFDSRRVTSINELEAALEAAETGGECFFVEIQMKRMDAPEALKTLGAVYARQDYGRSWPGFRP
jgi:indolepyruvate decarboxylase